MSEALHILVIDDDPVDRMAVKRAVRAAGLAGEVAEAIDVRSAIEQLGRQAVDCILLDHRLPDRDAAIVLRELRAAGCRAPVIIMTGQGSEQLAVDLMKAGASDYVSKSSVSLEHLAASVRGAVRVNRAEAQAQQATQNYRFLAESIPQFVWTADAQGSVDYVNQRWLEYTGLSLAESVGSGWQVVVHPDDAQRCMQAWRDTIENRTAYEVEYRLRRGRDGAYRWHLGRATPMRDADGKIIKWFGTSTDIHDFKEAEESLRKAKDAAEAANNAKDQFLAVLSHELRTPLMPVLTSVQTMELESTLSRDMKEGLDVIRRNVELEARLIDDLLDLTRISKGKLQLNFESVDLHAAIEGAVKICSVDLVSKHLRTTLDLRAERHIVRGDLARLQQVFWNLIKNAIKFTPTGGHITVHSFDDPGGSVKVHVTDTGIGIEPQAIARIFDAFEQADQSVTRQFGGLGLGLAISKALVDLHGGKLTADSPGVGQGSRFSIELRPTATATEHHEKDSGPAIASAALDPCKLSILLVDDHRDTNRAMARLLTRLGYQVQTADSVQSALHAAEQDQFDLLISDIGLPDGSGLELMRQLLSRQPILKGIALSGFGMEEDVKKSKEAGFYEHLTKPINFKRLETAIRDLTT